jgi:hypothetical protein
MTIPLTAGITLLSGKMFDYLNPGATLLDVQDIATLSNICRFAGHLPIFYSVAQHLVNTSYIVDGDEDLKYEALMHDRSEAFTNDIPTPLKVALPAFKALEIEIERATAPMFGVPVEMSPAVKLADRQMLGLEMRYVKRDFGDHEVLDGIDFAGLERAPGVILSSLTPREAKQAFLSRFAQLNGYERMAA